MIQGLSPQQIVDSVIANDAQGNPTLRQYGVVDFRDGVVRSAAYTGENCDDYKNHIIGPNYAIQGNILLGQHILDSMEARFLAEGGALACKLMAALQGAKVVGADTRCLSDGISSIGSFLRVAQPDDELGDLYLDINIPRADEGVDPIDSLQSIIDDWGGCTTTDISSIEKKTILKVYPNPAEKYLNFEFDPNSIIGKTELILYNTKGQEVIRTEIESATISIETSDISRGIYFYKLQSDGTSLTVGKVILE